MTDKVFKTNRFAIIISRENQHTVVNQLQNIDIIKMEAIIDFYIENYFVTPNTLIIC